MKQESFFATHEDVLGLVGDAANWQEVFSSGQREDHPLAVKRLASSTLVGESMFKGDMLKVNRATFIIDVDKRLLDVAHLDFEAGAVEAFRAACRAGAENLIQLGAKRFEKRQSAVEFFGRAVVIDTESPNDEWDWRLAAFTKQIGFNTKKLQATAWEKLLFEPGELEGIPSACNMPVQNLKTSTACRAELVDLIGSEPRTLVQMLKDVRNKIKLLRKVDEFVDLEVEFLAQHAEELLKEKLRAEMLGYFPGPLKRDVTTKEVMLRIPIC